MSERKIELVVSQSDARVLMREVFGPIYPLTVNMIDGGPRGYWLCVCPNPLLRGSRYAYTRLRIPKLMESGSVVRLLEATLDDIGGRCLFESSYL